MIKNLPLSISLCILPMCGSLAVQTPPATSNSGCPSLKIESPEARRCSIREEPLRRDKPEDRSETDSLLSLQSSEHGEHVRLQEGFIETHGAELFFRTTGQGSPLIVLHGGPGFSQEILYRQMLKLADTNRVIFYDQRGCGSSTGEITPESITVESYINDLEAIRKAFHYEKISILGYSWGGYLAMQYALAYPHHVEKMILSNSLPASSEDMALFAQEFARRTAPYQDEISEIRASQAFQDGHPDTAERLYRTICQTYLYHPEKVSLLNLRMTKTAFLNGLKVSEIFDNSVFKATYSLHNGLKNLQIPTLIIHGDTDPIPPICAKHIHESIPQSELIFMRKCGHFPPVECPEAYFTSIEDFLHGNEVAN